MLPRQSAPGLLTHLRCIDSNKACAAARTSQKKRHRVAVVDGYDRRLLERRGRRSVDLPKSGGTRGNEQKKASREQCRDEESRTSSHSR